MLVRIQHEKHGWRSQKSETSSSIGYVYNIEVLFSNEIRPVRYVKTENW